MQYLLCVKNFSKHFRYLASEVKVVQLCPTLCDPMNYTVHGILQARTLELVAIPFSRGSSQPRNRTQVSCTAGFSLQAEPQGKPKNTGMGSLSLLQGIFLTPELNRGLLYCRQILYQLSYKGSPTTLEWVAYPFSRGSSWPRNQTGVSSFSGDSLPTELWGAYEVLKPQKRKFPTEIS